MTKQIITKKDLQHAYFLLNGHVSDTESDRAYLLELQRWFLDKIERLELEEKNEFKVHPCHDAEFKGIDCLEMEDQFGFFNSDHDVRPGHAIWLDKDEAERLFTLFTRKIRA